MKLVSFEHEGVEGVGILEAGETRVSVLQAKDMLDVIGRGQPEEVGSIPAVRTLDVRDIRLKAPLARPQRNIFCVGKNYREHAREFARSGYEAGAVAGAEIDEYPAVFTKPWTSVIATGEQVDLHPDVTSAVDYEGELGVVIGREGSHISKESAFQHVWGYTIINDVTARDRQKNHKQWFLGKALDTFCPMGPWLVTADEVEATNLTLETYVNGELRQNANTRDLIFDIPTLIATLSSGMRLMPGDIISTGTPAGVGIGMKPPRFLASGDIVEIRITGLGALTNTFV
ncbi:Oxaloacetate tautomerase YisK [Pararobbsia alpina]|uniref:fumarylacetoacetate hydrolase family protein n=1 Tax=Pararobbsia alpina TaxID=621374 RepID=UPI0039A494B6